MHALVHENSRNSSQQNILLDATGNPPSGDAGDEPVPALHLIDGFHELAVFIRGKRKSALQNRLGAEGLHQDAEILQISPVIDEGATRRLVELLHHLHKPLAATRKFAIRLQGLERPTRAPQFAAVKGKAGG